MKDLVKINKYGFYSISTLPTEVELERYYAEKYYQLNLGSYEKKYEKAEIEYFFNKIEQKYYVISQHFKGKTKKKKFLDIGCGEGWALRYFKRKDWDVLGIDYSDYGCQKNNRNCLDNLIVGDVYKEIKKLTGKNKKYDVLLLDNVLEHALNPYGLLSECLGLIDANGILVVDVPNDFSPLQRYLIKEKYVDKKYWIVLPDHLHYFSANSLSRLCKAVGWREVKMVSDYPIEMNLLNSNTNYVKDKSKGKSCYWERIKIENLMHNMSIKATISMYEAMTKLDLGRVITGFFVPY